MTVRALRLRRVWLTHAHRDLVAADRDAGTTVTEVAARWGSAVRECGPRR
ncbi:hypothetical protein ABT131_33460 [Streptomyces sp900105245]